MNSSLPLVKINDEVFVARDEVVHFSSEAINFLRTQALKNARGRARLCAHKAASDSLHEMLICISQSSYVAPHRHHSKSESFHLIDGDADVVIFTDAGDIDEVVALGKDKTFFYRLDTPRYHTVIVNSPFLIIHETTNGPFDANLSDFAPFAPLENTQKHLAYISNLRDAVSRWKALK